MPVVKVQKIPRTVKVNKYKEWEDTIATFCYFYPQYTFAQARKLSERRIKQMLRIARIENAKKMYDFMQIIASQHTKKLKGVDKILKHYKDIIES